MVSSRVHTEHCHDGLLSNKWQNGILRTAIHCVKYVSFRPDDFGEVAQFRQCIVDLVRAIQRVMLHQ
jgi:hypothetical protein